MKVEFAGEEFNLRQYPTCDDIPYHKSCSCSCGYANFMDRKTYNLIGFCNTTNGLFGIFECEKCFDVYKHHVGSNKYDLEEFREDTGQILYMKKHNR